MSMIQHGVRVGLLMVGVAGLLGWLNDHTDVLFADGLRYIDQAERIERGAWSDGLIRSVDHPIYPMAIAAVHRVLGGEGPDLLAAMRRRSPRSSPGSCWSSRSTWSPWRSSARRPPGSAACSASASALRARRSINVLSESTFLLFWTWGVWAAVRFLREGRFVWLPLTIGFGALAYLTRPEGLLLPLALVATLLVLPLLWATRINWPRWWAAMAFLVLGPAAAGRPVHGGQGRARDQAGDRPAARDGAEVGRPGRSSGNARSTRTRRRSRPTAGDPADAQVVRTAVTTAAPAPGPARPGDRAALVGPRSDLALHGDHRGGVDPGPGPAARDRGLLHGPARAGPGDAPDPGGRRRPGLADAFDRDPRAVARAWRGAVPARPRRSGPRSWPGSSPSRRFRA